MEKEVLIYGTIDSYSAREFITQINECCESEPNCDIVARLNTNGGDVDYAFGAIGKFAELKNKKTVKVDGKAHSMGFYFCCYADKVEALDVSEFLIHRAAYPDWVESNPTYFTEERRKSIENTNLKLRAALEGKLDVAVFEKITKTTLDAIFSMDDRKDVRLTAEQARKCGLVQSITNITPKKKAEIEAKMYSISAKHQAVEIAAHNIEQPNKSKKMTLEELKNEHPGLYAQVIELGKAAGVKQEKNRIQAWAHFIEVDAKTVKEGINGCEDISQLQIIELSEKKFNAAALEKLNADAATAAASGGAGAASGAGEAAKTKEQKEIDDFKAGVLANSSLGTAK